MSALPALLLVPVVLSSITGGGRDPIAAVLAVPKVAIDVVQHAGAGKTISDAMPIVETVADVIFPGAGLGVGVIFFALSHSRPATPDEERAQLARFGIDTQR